MELVQMMNVSFSYADFKLELVDDQRLSLAFIRRMQNYNHLNSEAIVQLWTHCSKGIFLGNNLRSERNWIKRRPNQKPMHY